MNPLLLFPEEVWELILGSLESSKDMLTVVKAYPELRRIVSRNGYLWLFDQVLPEIYPWLPQKEFFYCRQVCKRWSRVVDTFLEMTTPDPQGTGEDLWLTTPGRRTYENGQYFKGICLQTCNSLDEFIKNMEGHHGRNPFPGRNIMTNVRRRRKDVHLEFYQKFGSHIWFAQLGCNPANQMERRLRFCESLIGTLADLPNLRRLKLTKALEDTSVDLDELYLLYSESDASDNDDRRLDSDEEEEEDSKLIEPLMMTRPLPPLPCLTTLEILECQLLKPLARMFIAHYAPQLERLLLHAKYWDREMYSFPRLRQLCIWDVETKEMVTEVLSEVEAPNLCSIQIEEVGVGDSGIVLDMVTDIFPWLRRYPQLERLHFYIPFYKSESSDEPTDEEKFPSVKSLQIGDHRLRLNYNFLLLFPSLEKLDIVEGCPSSRMQIANCAENSRVKIKECMEADNMYDCNVWELLPKLQKLRVSWEVSKSKDMEVYGNRRMYDFLKLGK